MEAVSFIEGYVDFESGFTHEKTLDLLSVNIFGGIKFREKDVDHEDNYGNMVLSDIFLGIEIEVVNADNKYTLELTTHPCATVYPLNSHADVSLILKKLIGNINGLKLIELTN